MEKFSGPLARRYGTALFESLKMLIKNKDDFIQINDYIKQISLVFTKNTLKLFQTQTIPLKQKEEFLTVILDTVKPTFSFESKKVQDSLFNFFLTIFKNKRAAYIPYIFDFYFKKSDKYLNIIRAQILSAQPMSQKSLQEFENNIANNVQQKVVFSNFVDESLKSGFLIKIGSTHIDASLKSFLTKLNEAVR